MNVVLGYGNVGRLIAEELRASGEDVMVVRHAGGKIEGLESITVDALDRQSVEQALHGAQRVFVTTGLEYNLKVWQRDWPILIDNVIAGAKVTNAKLIFIDNIYLYGPAPLQNPITEEHPRKPVSRKGLVRLGLVEKLEEAEYDGLDVLIVRCADFYGPKVDSSGITMAIEAMVKSKTGYFMGDPKTRHTYSYVPDIARASVALAIADDTYSQTWHAPSAAALTGNELMTLVEETMGKKGKWKTMSRNSMLLMGVFIPILRELREMMYQFESDYVFDSSKFASRFPDFKLTSYEEGIKATVSSNT